MHSRPKAGPDPAPKPVRWVGESKSDLSAFPNDVKLHVGGAQAVYVLHAFQKKSRQGIATPKAELDLIAARLIRAKEDYAQWLRSRSSQ